MGGERPDSIVIVSSELHMGMICILVALRQHCALWLRQLTPGGAGAIMCVDCAQGAFTSFKWKV